MIIVMKYFPIFISILLRFIYKIIPNQLIIFIYTYSVITISGNTKYFGYKITYLNEFWGRKVLGGKEIHILCNFQTYNTFGMRICAI